MQGSFSFLLPIFIVTMSYGICAATGHARPVPPTLELIVLDPNADPVGNPAVEFRPGPGDQLQIDIPPAIIVHRFYYTGDRSFQGPFLKGGPTTIVANHPRTGERVYVPVQLPPGAPRVTYTHHSIEYDFGSQGVTITFPKLAHKPTVAYRNHKSITRGIGPRVDNLQQSTKNLLDRSGITQVARTVHSTSKNMAINAVDLTSDAVKFGLRPVAQLGQLIPGINALTSSPEDQATRLRASQNQLLETEKTKNQLFFPTNR